MKKKILLAVSVVLLISNCKDPFVKFTSLAEDNKIFVPDIIESEESPNDPQKTGLICATNDSTLKSKSTEEFTDLFDIYDNLPDYQYVDVKYDTYKYFRTTAKSAAKKKVIGYKISGKLNEMCTSTDVVLTITKVIVFNCSFFYCCLI